jgi:hypothetical protein
VLRENAPDGKVDVPGIMADIGHNATLFERITKAEGADRFARFLQRMLVLDVIVFTPVLLALMGRAGSDEKDRVAAAEFLESYLIRRTICGEQTRGYGTLALRLLRVMRIIPGGEPVSNAIAGELARSISGVDAWPDDESFRTQWLKRRFYNGLRRDRVLMILQALEEAYQGGRQKAEPLMTFDLSRLQIEHILPRSWRDHWPVQDEGATAEDRDWALDGIGNLTLVSARLNPSLSNGPWNGPPGACKRSGLQEHSRLELNRRLLAGHEEWNERQMQVRASELFEMAREIWPFSTSIVTSL